MMRLWITVVILAAGFPGAARAAEPGKEGEPRYKSIVERNVFGLRPPAPPPTPAPPPPPSVAVKLTGIITVLATKRALLLITEPGKPPESKVIKLGDREGQIEVVEIDENAGTVRIKNGEQEATLNFQDHGVKPPTGPAPTPPPVVAGQPMPPNVMPGVVMPGAAPPNPALPNPALPPNLARPVRTDITFPPATNLPGSTIPSPVRIPRQ
jgi:hypothetical protein